MVAQLDRDYARRRPLKVWQRIVAYTLFEGRPLTTKGQWINPFLSKWFKAIGWLPQLKNVSAPIFIIGTGRSGTTVLGLVLSMHKHLNFLNEPKAIWHAVHPLDDIIGTYANTSPKLLLTQEDATPERAQLIRRIYGAYLRISGTKRVVDKYPELVFRIPYVLGLFPNAKFVFISRNGWDTCASITHWSERLGQETDDTRDDWWGRNDRKWHTLVTQVVPLHADLAPHTKEILSWDNHFHRAALEWIVTMRAGLRATAEYPDQVYHLPYENLCADPSSAVQDLAAFLGLENDDVLQTFAADRLKVASASAPISLPSILQIPFKKVMLDLI